MEFETTYTIKMTKREAIKLRELLIMLSEKQIKVIQIDQPECFSASELAEVASDLYEAIKL